MKSFKEKLYFHREKEENWGLEKKGKKKGFENYNDLVYVGSEIDMNVEIIEQENGEIHIKVLKLKGKDVSDKEIYI